MESTLIAVWIGTAAVSVALFSLVLLVRFLPNSAQKRVASVLIRWNQASIGLLDRAAYPWAVFMVVTIGLMLIGAIALLFVPR